MVCKHSHRKMEVNKMCKKKIVNEDEKKPGVFAGMCVRCGDVATEGSLKHPYCGKCFTVVWKNDYDKYCEYLENDHH